GSGAMAGPWTMLPSSRRNWLSCHGHVTHPRSIVPSSSGPPRWVHLASMPFHPPPAAGGANTLLEPTLSGTVPAASGPAGPDHVVQSDGRSSNTVVSTPVPVR